MQEQPLLDSQGNQAGKHLIAEGREVIILSAMGGVACLVDDCVGNNPQSLRGSSRSDRGQQMYGGSEAWLWNNGNSVLLETKNYRRHLLLTNVKKVRLGRK